METLSMAFGGSLTISRGTHISDVTAKVTDILTNRLGILTTISSKERILFGIDELYLGENKCDPSFPLCTYARVGRAKFQCDASALPQGNEWNVQYLATCVWTRKKPPCTQIFNYYISNCPTYPRLDPGHVYEGHVVKLAPPNTALAVTTVKGVKVPVLIFLNRLYQNSNLKKLSSYEWIQDHLNTRDIVEFKFEKSKRKVTHKKFHVALLAWKTRNCVPIVNEENVQSNSNSSPSEVKKHQRSEQDNNTVSKVGTSGPTNSVVSHVGICSGTNGSTANTVETKGISDTCNAEEDEIAFVESAVDIHLLLGMSKLMKRGISPWMCSNLESYFINGSQQRSNIKASAAMTSSQEYVTGEETLSSDGSLPVMSEEETTVTLYRIPRSLEIPRACGIGVVQNDLKIQTITPQFSYELFKSLTSQDVAESQFRALLVGFVVFHYMLPQYPKTSASSHEKYSHLTVGAFEKAGIRMPKKSSNKQRKVSEPSGVLKIELKMPSDPLSHTYIAVPKIPSSPQPGIAAEITGLRLPEDVPCNVFVPSPVDLLRIPVTLGELPSLKLDLSAYKALMSQGQLPINPNSADTQSSESVRIAQTSNLDSTAKTISMVSAHVQRSVPPELESNLSSSIEEAMKLQRSASENNMGDLPHFSVPIFLPLSLQSSSEQTSAFHSTTWTLTCGSMATENNSLMYIPSNVLMCTKVNTQSLELKEIPPNQPSDCNAPRTKQLTVIDNSALPPEQPFTAKPSSTHCGKYRGHIHSLDDYKGTIAFKMGTKVEKAMFFLKKVYVNGNEIGSQSKLRDIVSCEMPVTLDVKRYEGDTLFYKATAVYVQTLESNRKETDEEQPKPAQETVEAYQDTSPPYEATKSVETNLSTETVGNGNEENVTSSETTKSAGTNLSTETVSYGNEENATASEKSITEDTLSVDQTVIEDKVFQQDMKYFLTQQTYEDSFPMEHIHDCVCKACSYKQNLLISKTVKDLTIGTLTLPSVAQDADDTSHETTKKSKSCTELKPLNIVKPSELAESFLPQIQHVTKSNNGQKDYVCPSDPLPQSAKNVAGVLEAMWSSDAVIMTTIMHKLKVRVIVHRKNLFVDGKLCIITKTLRHEIVEGSQVHADVSKLRDHPSGAVYFATCAWKGKKPTIVSNTGNRHCGKCGNNVEACGNCLQKPPSNVVGSLKTQENVSKVILKLKEDGSTGRRKSKSHETKVIKSPGDNERIGRRKATFNGDFHGGQRRADASVEPKKQKCHKALQNVRNLLNKQFEGVVKSFTFENGFGLVNFQLQDETVTAIFFGESIFSKGVAVTDMQIKEEITAGRLVTVSNVSPYYGEDIQYAANIDTELQDRASEEVQSYSAVATYKVQEPEIKAKNNDAQDLEFPSHKFAVKQREIFYKGRQNYVWDRQNEVGVDQFKDMKVMNPSNKVKMEEVQEQLCQVIEETGANSALSSNDKEPIQLPVTPTQPIGLAKQLKGKLARVKRYESSTRGVLECSVSGAAMEVTFHKRVVDFSGNNPTTYLKDCLPVGREVYFNGQIVGEVSLLGCPDIVVTSVWESKTHRKQATLKRSRSLEPQLAFLTKREGLAQGKIYVGIVTQVEAPNAFIATVTEDGKTYEVFVLNKFFSPIEHGEKLPPKHPVVPFIAEGYKVNMLINRRKEENSHYKYEWFAMDAWTEQGDNAFPGTKPEASYSPKESEADDLHDCLEGVMVTVYPEWGLLKVDQFEDEVTFFGQDASLFGVPLGKLDLRQVFRTGESVHLTLAEEAVESGTKKASKVWFGSRDTPSDIRDLSQRSVNIFNYCKSREMDKNILVILTNELGKQRKWLETNGTIRTWSVDEEEEEENVWLKPVEDEKAPGHIGISLPDSGDQNDFDEVYYSDSPSDSDMYMSNERKENDEESRTESSAKQLEVVECENVAEISDIDAEKKSEVTSVNNADTVSSFSVVSNLERREDFDQNQSLTEDSTLQGSEYGTLPETVKTADKNGNIVPHPGAGISGQQQTLLTLLPSACQTSFSCIDGATSLRNMTCSPMPVLHPEMQQTLQSSLCEILQKRGVQPDVSWLIALQAVAATEDELKAVLTGKLLDKALKKVTGLGCRSDNGGGSIEDVKVKAGKETWAQMFQTPNDTLTQLSQEWRGIISEAMPTVSAAGEEDDAQDRNLLQAGHAQSGEVQFEGRVDQETQTISTGRILYLEIRSDF